MNDQREKKENEIPKGRNNTLLPKLFDVSEPMLRTNENKTVASNPIDKEIVRSNDSTTLHEKLKADGSIQTGDSIVFPDNIDEIKSAHKGIKENLNKTSSNNENNEGNYTKNSDDSDIIVFPGHNVPTQTTITPIVNPIQNANGNPFTSSGSQSPQNYVYQTLPVTNDVFPNRPAVYTTANTGQGSLYTNIINTFPQNGQSFKPALNSNNNNNNYYQSPTPISPVNSWNGNQNVGIVNSIPPSNVGNSVVNLGTVQNQQNTLGVPALLISPNSIGNNQPVYNRQQQILQPANIAQNNNLIQQRPTVLSEVTPFSHNQGNIATQGNYNPAPNNIGQQFVVGQTFVPNNMQKNNGQQYYVISNGNRLNNYENSAGQSVVLNPQGNMMTPNNNVLGDNTQKHMLVNVDQQNVQNGQTNGISLQNGQLVLVPYQGTNNALVNNGINGQTQIITDNIIQPMPNAANSITANQPNTILINGIPNNVVFQDVNGQNYLVNVGQNVFKLVPVSNVGNSENPYSIVNLISLNDKDDRSTGINKSL
ncbi:putative uncharacterized protein DDB_G0282133 isoform X2 [Plodia interpunctella]|nr:putative uncharacterized protein DDB_G0282133 isoform X2 [Plodia interpunctella]